MAERVGFIGLGIMGMPMARNLMDSGYELTVHNRSPEKAEELGKEGAAVAATPRELSEAIKEKGASMLDAPVSGGDVGAIEGTLSIMVGGEEADFHRAKPLFEAMGKTITHVGPVGAGQVTKAANQVVVALTIEAVCEALVLGSAGGVAPEKVLEVLSGGLAANKVMEVKREKFLSHKFEPGFRSELHHKDLGIALAAGREYGVVLPVTAIVDQMLLAMRKKGWGGEDHSALLRVIEDLSQHEI